MVDLDRLKAANMAHIVGAASGGVGAMADAANEVLTAIYNSVGEWAFSDEGDTTDEDAMRAERDVMWELDLLDKWGYTKCDHEFRAELNTFRMLLPLIASERVRTRTRQVLDRWLKPKVG